MNKSSSNIAARSLALFLGMTLGLSSPAFALRGQNSDSKKTVGQLQAGLEDGSLTRRQFLGQSVAAAGAAGLVAASTSPAISLSVPAAGLEERVPGGVEERTPEEAYGIIQGLRTRGRVEVKWSDSPNRPPVGSILLSPLKLPLDLKRVASDKESTQLRDTLKRFTHSDSGHVKFRVETGKDPIVVTLFRPETGTRVGNPPGGGPFRQLGPSSGPRGIQERLSIPPAVKGPLPVQIGGSASDEREPDDIQLPVDWQVSAAGLEEVAVTLYDGLTAQGTGVLAPDAWIAEGHVRSGESRAVVALNMGILHHQVFIDARLPSRDFQEVEEIRFPSDPAEARAVLSAAGLEDSDLILLPLSVPQGSEPSYRPENRRTPIVAISAEAFNEATSQVMAALAAIARNLAGQVFRVGLDQWAEKVLSWAENLMSISY